MVYDFGPFRLDPGEGTISREGEAISVTPMVFSLVALLVKNHNRLVVRSEIFAELWDGVESHANLDRRISEVRKVLGPELSPCLKTVPKKGYRFECAVEEVVEGQAAARTRHLRIVLATVAVLAALIVTLLRVVPGPCGSARLCGGAGSPAGAGLCPRQKGPGAGDRARPWLSAGSLRVIRGLERPGL